MKFACSLQTALFALVVIAPQLAADDSASSSPNTSWELTPYRLQLTVFVEPSARLLPALAADLQAQLIAATNTTMGGPWQVTANDKLASLRSQLLVSLSDLEAPPLKLNADTSADKLLFVAISEQAGKLQVCAREWDVACQAWNSPVTRTTSQVSRLPAESLQALLAAFGPLARLEAIDKDNVTLKLRAGSIPCRDGSYLTGSSISAFRPFVLSRSAEQPVTAGTATLVPWTYITPLPIAAGTTRAQFRGKVHTSLGGQFFPEYHPRQLRVALGVAQGTMPTIVHVVDDSEAKRPLEGYDVFTQPLGGTSAVAEQLRLGVTNRAGELALPTTVVGLQRITIKHGSEELTSIPLIPGSQGRLQLTLPSDRKRLELAAAIAEFNDDLLDQVAKQAILAVQMKEALLKGDLTAIGKVAAELQSQRGKDKLSARLAQLAQSVATADEATRRRLEPQLAETKQALQQLSGEQAP
ncbi:hypothetical protein NA78x_003601 [Anatilimnocola sp. NA78]|uniref:hypothetical protein n=1 Tax=Anatilimnocola sp. NA78 TaxID=3415683 RepID=UPI003CE5C84B